MNIFNKITIQSMKKSRTRTIVTIIGVILSATLITGVTTFGISLMNYLAKGAAQKYGDWHIEFENVNSSFAAKQASNDKVVKATTFKNIGYAKLEGVKTANKPYLFIAGYSKKNFNDLPPILMVMGRMPQNSREIVVPGKVMTKGGVKVQLGDKFTIDVGSRMNGNKNLGQHDTYISGKETLVPKTKMTYTVVGICQTPPFEEDYAPGYTAITTAGSEDTMDDLSLFVTLKNPREVHTYAKSTAESHAYTLNNQVLRFMGLSSDPGDKFFNAFLYSVGGIVVVIIMIGSIFLIYNSFNISLNERTHQFGILSSVGATAKQLRHSVLFEGICIGVIGIPIGVLVGIASTKLVMVVVAKKFTDIAYAGVPFTVVVSAPVILAAVVISMITILISADIPARKAASMPVMECIRQTNEVKVEAKAVKTSKLAQRIYGFEGVLALKNFKRNKKRYRSIVLSLVLSVVLFISTSAMVMDLQQTTAGAKESESYDIGFGADDMKDSEMLQLYNKLKTTNGVYESSYQVVMNYSCAVKNSDFSDAYKKSVGSHSLDKTVNLSTIIQFLDDSTYLNIVQRLGLPKKEYTGPNAKLISVAKVDSGNDNQKTVNQLPDMFKSSSMNFTIVPEINGKPEIKQGRNVSITFVSTMLMPDIPPSVRISLKKPSKLSLIAPYSLKEKFNTSNISPDINAKGMTFWSKDPSQSVAKMEVVIKGAKIKDIYTLINSKKVFEENKNEIFIVDVFSYTFIIMISLIAVANVFNTISTNIKLRRRELAMLRSMGMSDRDFQKMMNFECVFYGMKALIFGLPLAIIFSWLMHKVMSGDSTNFVLPWDSIGISVFSVLFIVFITMMYSISKIKKENIIDALRDDMD